MKHRHETAAEFGVIFDGDWVPFRQGKSNPLVGIFEQDEGGFFENIKINVSINGVLVELTDKDPLYAQIVDEVSDEYAAAMIEQADMRGDYLIDRMKDDCF